MFVLVGMSIELRLTHHERTPAITAVTVAGPLVCPAENLLFLCSDHRAAAPVRVPIG